MRPIQTVNLAGPRPYRPSYRPFLGNPERRIGPQVITAPPSPQIGRKNLGEYNSERLGPSILWAAGGAAAFFAGGIAPTPFDLIIKALGVGAVGYGAYHLFAGEGGGPINICSADGFNKIEGLWQIPSKDDQNVPNSNGTTHAELLVSNSGNDTCDFQVFVDQTETCTMFSAWQNPLKGSTWFGHTFSGNPKGVTDTKTKTLDPIKMTLGPGKQDVLKFDIKQICDFPYQISQAQNIYFREKLVARKARYGVSAGAGGELDTIEYRSGY